uniref:Uncharacterized protein n=1 Tax=Plectus sambesii TaxID=2011161 RepID=A0A914XJ81_9BILA
MQGSKHIARAAGRSMAAAMRFSMRRRPSYPVSNASFVAAPVGQPTDSVISDDYDVALGERRCRSIHMVEHQGQKAAGSSASLFNDATLSLTNAAASSLIDRGALSDSLSLSPAPRRRLARMGCDFFQPR